MTLRTSQEGFIPTGFVKLITVGVLKKKRMALSFVCAKIFIKYHIFSEYLAFQNFVSRFSQNVGLTTYLQENSTIVLYKVKYFFLFERASKTAGPVRLGFLNEKAFLSLGRHFLRVFRVNELINPFLRLIDKSFKKKESHRTCILRCSFKQTKNIYILDEGP